MVSVMHAMLSCIFYLCDVRMRIAITCMVPRGYFRGVLLKKSVSGGSFIRGKSVKEVKPSRCIKASLNIHENRLNFPTTKGFRVKISIKLAYQYMVIFFNISPTSNHLHPLQVENCDSNSWLVVDEDDNGKFRLERAKPAAVLYFSKRTSMLRNCCEL